MLDMDQGVGLETVSSALEDFIEFREQWTLLAIAIGGSGGLACIMLRYSVMAALSWIQISALDKRWTSESASTQTSYKSTTEETTKATARARSASRSNVTTGSDSTATTAADSRRTARTTTSSTSNTRSLYSSGSTKTEPSANQTLGTSKVTSHNTGPASVPSGDSSAGHHSTADLSHSGLTSGAKTAVIVATVIGGTLILAILIVLLLRLFRRKRKSAAVVDTDQLRPPSTTTFLSTKTRDANLTALPMYRERRRQQVEAANRPPDMQELYKHDPRWQDTWKTANPPTPVTSQFPVNDVELGDAQLGPPEMTQVRNASPVIPLSTHDRPNIDPVESIYAPSAIDLEPGMWPHTPTSGQPLNDRWSWTTSYATAKSKPGRQSLASTIASLPAVRRVKEWIGSTSDGQRESSPIREGESGPSRTSSVTFLKNKATKPNLAPVPTRELSRRQLLPTSEPTATEPSPRSTKQLADRNDVLEDVDAIVPDDGVFS